MSEPRTVVVTAPGKLFVTGEYAVTQPEWLSVLIAVDRRLRVVLDSAAEPAELLGSAWSSAASRRFRVGLCCSNAVGDGAVGARGRARDRPLPSADL